MIQSHRTWEAGWFSGRSRRGNTEGHSLRDTSGVDPAGAFPARA